MAEKCSLSQILRKNSPTPPLLSFVLGGKWAMRDEEMQEQPLHCKSIDDVISTLCSNKCAPIQMSATNSSLEGAVKRKTWETKVFCAKAPRGGRTPTSSGCQQSNNNVSHGITSSKQTSFEVLRSTQDTTNSARDLFTNTTFLSIFLPTNFITNK
jgi:hypothetical protein